MIVFIQDNIFFVIVELKTTNNEFGVSFKSNNEFDISIYNLSKTIKRYFHPKWPITQMAIMFDIKNFCKQSIKLNFYSIGQGFKELKYLGIPIIRPLSIKSSNDYYFDKIHITLHDQSHHISIINIIGKVEYSYRKFI